MSWVFKFFKSIYIQILCFLFFCQILFLSIFVLIDYASPQSSLIHTEERLDLALFYLEKYVEKNDCSQVGTDISKAVFFERPHETWVRIVDSNPKLWFYYYDKACSFSRSKNKAELDIENASAMSVPDGEQCTQVSSYFQHAGSMGHYFYTRCNGVIERYSEVGALPDSFQFPLLANLSFVRGAVLEPEMIIKSYFAMLLAMPVVILLFLHPIRRASSYASKISPLSRGTQIPTKGVFSEVSGLIEAVNLALRRLDAGHERERHLRNAIAHELKTPLTCMRTDLEEVDDESLRQRLVSDVWRMDSLIDQILQFARAASQIEFTEELDLVREVRAACAETGINAITHGQEINFINKAGKRVYVRTNKSALFLILVNLINNAILHSKADRSIDVIISSDGKPSGKTGSVGKVEIRDYGVGLDEALVKHINGDFHEKPPKALTTKMGFGLNLIVELVQLAELDLKAENHALEGVTFTLIVT